MVAESESPPQLWETAILDPRTTATWMERKFASAGSSVGTLHHGMISGKPLGRASESGKSEHLMPCSNDIVARNGARLTATNAREARRARQCAARAT